MAKINFSQRHYYQYNTATAGTGAAVGTDGANATASICPSGNDGSWVLPLSGTANNNTSGSFYYLLNFYNATSGQTAATNIVQLPLAFVRSGYVSTNSSMAYYVGERGYNWSRSSSSPTNAYYLVFTLKEVNSSYDDARWCGRPLRCLYPGSA